MDQGYTIDHVVDSGKLITLFSAPDYPQFQVLTGSLSLYLAVDIDLFLIFVLLSSSSLLSI